MKLRVENVNWPESFPECFYNGSAMILSMFISFECFNPKGLRELMVKII